MKGFVVFIIATHVSGRRSPRPSQSPNLAGISGRPDSPRGCGRILLGPARCRRTWGIDQSRPASVRKTSGDREPGPDSAGKDEARSARTSCSGLATRCGAWQQRARPRAQVRLSQTRCRHSPHNRYRGSSLRRPFDAAAVCKQDISYRVRFGWSVLFGNDFWQPVQFPGPSLFRLRPETQPGYNREMIARRLAVL